MERDEALLRKVGDTIAAEPERYDQKVWWLPHSECGSVACLAGHAVELAGLPVSTLTEKAIDETAEEVLGLTGYEAGRLFWGGWLPRRSYLGQQLGESIRDALYRLADGASIDEVSA